MSLGHPVPHAATHCNTLQHTATHCNTLQHTATHCNTLQHTATQCNTLQHIATHCSTLSSLPGDSCAVMGWLRLVGSLNLQVSFAKEPYKRDDILRKRPMNLRSHPVPDKLLSMCVCVCVRVCVCVSIYTYQKHPRAHIKNTYIYTYFLKISFCQETVCGKIEMSWQWFCIYACGAVCCSLLQYVAFCCSFLQFVAVCCSLLQSVAVCCILLQSVLGDNARGKTELVLVMCGSLLQSVAVYCNFISSLLQIIGLSSKRAV